MILARIEAPNLASGDVSLLPYDQSHVADTVRWLTQQDIKNTFGITRDITVEGHVSWLASQEDYYIWAISHDSEYVGNTSLRINERHREGVFEIYIGNRGQRGSGVGEQVLLAVLKYAFLILKLHRVSLVTLLDNAAAESLYKKVGFTVEGIMRECLLTDRGYVSQRLWSILTTEWQSRSR